MLKLENLDVWQKAIDFAIVSTRKANSVADAVMLNTRAASGDAK
jgi:hypothetical protein